MASVTFSTTIGGDGSTITDDTDPFTGLDGGGHRARFVPTLEQMVAVAEHVVGTAATVNDESVAAVEAAAAAAGSAAAAEGDRVATAADRVQTGLDAAATAADRLQTGQDRVQTGLDAAATAADRLQAGLDAQATAADRVQTGQDRLQAGLDAQATAADSLQTGQDAAATAADRIATGQDRTQTGQDRTATGADRLQTGLDAQATAADRVQTGQDASATAADRIATGQDRQATAADRVATGQDAAAAADSAAAAEIAAAASLTHSQVSATERQYATLARDDAEVFAAATAADRVQTGLDVVATGQDRVQTGLDRTTSSLSAADALLSEQAAAASAALIGPPVLPAIASSAALAPGVIVESAAVTVSGSTSTVWPAVVRGDGTPEVQVNAGPWAQSAIFRSGDTVKLRNTSPPDGFNYVATLYAHSFSTPWSLVPLPVTLFAGGEQGVWYDPSDMSTMFQDPAGATPVTAVEQPVGRILDKSGRGNHATQPTATARPVLSARYNLLTKTEQFDDADWTKSNATVTADVIASPDGTVAADKVIPSTTSSTHLLARTAAFSSADSVTIYAKAGEYYKIGFSETANTAQGSAIVDLRDGSMISSAAQVGATVVANAGDGWYRITWTPSFGNIVNNSLGIYVVPNNASAGWYIWQNSWVGDGTSGLYIWGASITPTGQASLPYQRVNTATDYDADPTKFKPYLKFDGVDDFLVTNTITPGTDKVQVFAGTSSLSSGTAGIIVESGQNFNPGGIAIYRNSNNTYGLQGHNGSGFMGYVTSAIPADASKVLAMGYDIAASGSREAEALFSRVNGVTDRSVAEGPWTDGNGNFALNALYIGRRGGTSLPFNGRLYSLITRFGSNLSTDQITQTENWVNSKTGAY